MRAAADPASPEMKVALTRIGSVMQAQIRLNIRRYRAVDFGGLINSINYQVKQSGSVAFVEIGSYGIRYAARNEFGGPMNRGQVIAMLIALRKRAAPGGRSKGVVKINPDGTGFWKPRPFIRDALKSNSQFVIDTLRTLNK